LNVIPEPPDALSFSKISGPVAAKVSFITTAPLPAGLIFILLLPVAPAARVKAVEVAAVIELTPVIVAGRAGAPSLLKNVAAEPLVTVPAAELIVAVGLAAAAVESVPLVGKVTPVVPVKVKVAANAPTVISDALLGIVSVPVLVVIVRPLTVVGVIAPSVKVIAGVVVAVATLPDTPFAVTTETDVTVPELPAPPPLSPGVSTKLLPLFRPMFGLG